MEQERKKPTASNPEPLNSSRSLPQGESLSRQVSWIREQPFALPALFLLLAWLQLFVSLTPFWSLGTYYDYGWFVPPAAGWFFWKRWQSLQPRLPSAAPTWPKWAEIAGLAALLSFVLLLFIFRAIERYDLFWRPPRLVHAILLCLVHHGVIARLFGWKNSAFFLPVTAFCLTAVPMPLQGEQAVIQWATRKLMAVSEPVCQFQGMPVTLSGSALTLNGAALEIDQGCSGIRSLQSLFMLAIFAGEFFLLGWISRVALVFAGFGFAFFFNAVRVQVLTHVFFHSGEDAFHSWHDFVGTTTFSLSALALLGLAYLLKRLSPLVAACRSAPAPHTV